MLDEMPVYGAYGKFSFALWDEGRQRLLLGRDHFGIETLYYSGDSNRLVFGTSLRALLGTRMVSKELNYAAVLQYLLYCYNPTDETFMRDDHKVPAGHLMVVDRSSITIKS